MTTLIVRVLAGVALSTVVVCAQAGNWRYNQPPMAPTHVAMAPKQAAPKQEGMMLPPPAAHPTDAKMPCCGIKLDKVRKDFGAPQQEIPAVGNPPILRWKYPAYIVYFEFDRVITSVPTDI